MAAFSLMLSLRDRPTGFALFAHSLFVGGSRSRIFLGGTEPEIHVIHLYLLHPMTSARVWRAVRSPSPTAAKRNYDAYVRALLIASLCHYPQPPTMRHRQSP